MNAPLILPPGLREGADYPSPVTRVLALGYYDGPTEGVLEIGPSGEVYRFAMVGELGGGADDSRTFDLSPLPSGSLQVLAGLLSPFMEPRWPVWAPIWRFPSPQIQQDVEGRVDRLLGQAGPVAWQITTDDLLGTLRGVKRLPSGAGPAEGGPPS